MRTLFELPKGKKCLVDKILSEEGMKRRLLDLGLTPNTLVECLNVSPHGDPKAFLIRGAVIALRREDCNNILIREAKL